MGNEIGTLPMDGIAFDAEEIKRLGKRFKKIDLDGSGSLSIEEFMALPELQQNPLVRSVLCVLVRSSVTSLNSISGLKFWIQFQFSSYCV